jgi:diguanylate cyclase (GGDEF)-like protein
VPHGRITATFYIVIAIAAALIIMVAVTRVALPRAWVLLAFGVLASATGDAIWFVFEFRGIEPFPSVADAFYLAYPLSGLLLLLLLARLVFDHGARMPVHLIVLVGVGLWLVADVVFGIGTLDGWYAGGGAIASLIAPLIVLIYGERDPTTVRVAAAGAVVLGLLVLLRMAGLTASIGELVTDFDHASNTDPLTGAANRRQLDQRLGTELSRSDRSGTPLSVVILDLDHFERFNDTYGHQAGDTLLREAVARWHRELRPADLLVRFGGEEFVVVFVDILPGDAEAAVERLRSVVPFGATCSAGLAHRTLGESSESLILRADLALYREERRPRSHRRCGRGCAVGP